MNTPDMFDGIFDSVSTGRREVWQDGRLRRFVRRECVGHTGSVWPEVHSKWGEYPDHPSGEKQEQTA
jgi:hypothetical protein